MKSKILNFLKLTFGEYGLGLPIIAFCLYLGYSISPVAFQILLGAALLTIGYCAGKTL